MQQGVVDITGPSADHLNLRQHTGRAVINWQEFSLSADGRVTISQPNAASVILNRVVGGSASEIHGRITANGQVFLVNPHGVLFGENAQINVGGLVASALDLSDADFAAGRYRFQGDGAVVNQGTLHSGSAGGFVALLGGDVTNSGAINSLAGTSALAAGKAITLDISGAGLIGVRVDEARLRATVTNSGVVRASAGGQAILAARAVGGALDTLVSNTGLVEATGLVTRGGRIFLSADAVESTGAISASNARGNGGTVAIDGNWVALGGQTRADGMTNGGSVTVNASGLSLAGVLSADGVALDGGSVNLAVERKSWETADSVVSARGGRDGGDIRHVAEQQITSSGNYLAGGARGPGGTIDLTASAVKLLGANFDASGASAGGRIRVGGEFQGGKNLAADELPNAQTLAVNNGVTLTADGRAAGAAGGEIILWADREAAVYGQLNAKPGSGGAGGFIEVSSGENLTFGGHADAGLGGTVLFDPKNITIADDTSGQYAMVLGFNYNTVEPIHGASIRQGDRAASVALNADGTLLVIGAPADDGVTGPSLGYDSGAVYLISFTDENFNGARFEGAIGKGYLGGKNINLPWLVEQSGFGTGVALNAAGNRLAAGGGGQVHLFSFADLAFGGGVLEARIGSGQTGGKNIDLSAVPGFGNHGNFGHAIALNDAGDRLAVAAPRNLGVTPLAPPWDAPRGAVFLFSFDDTNFSGGALEAVIGSGYTGAKDHDIGIVPAPNNSRFFGWSVALNGAGDRLAVGDIMASNRDGTVGLVGTVSLFSFADGNFGGVALEGTMGLNFVGGKNVHVPTVTTFSGFGSALALNSAGDRLAVGTQESFAAPGKVYLYSFADGDFSGAQLEGMLGRGFTGPKDLNLTLEDAGQFGSAVAFNGSGDRLVVGSAWADGANGTAPDSGSVQLFSFTDGNYSGAVREGVIGKDYVGGKNLALFSVPGVGDGDLFGYSVALNAAGNRLAVGAPQDDGWLNLRVNSGAVYLFTFADGDFNGGVMQGVIGDGYVGGKNLSLTFDTLEQFGSSLAFNAAGDRLAVGVIGDDGVGNATSNVGAVYLFSFADDSFSTGTLEAIIGKGYTGGKNFNVTNLDAGDAFGRVALNAAGDRLLASAIGDDSATGTTANAGAVYLFSFSDPNFSGATLEGIVGAGYTGGKNHSVAGLEANDNFGRLVALDATGQLMAVGAPGDDGATNALLNVGAVHLFSFADGNFGGVAREGVIGRGYTGAKNVDFAALEAGDAFGSGVALNATGGILAVGAQGDDGGTNTDNGAGAVHMFKFTAAAFGEGVWKKTVGANYSGSNLTVANLEWAEVFGFAVTLNAAGNRMVVGSPADWGTNDLSPNAGAAYLVDVELDDQLPATFAIAASGNYTLTPSTLTAVLNTGSNVVLQANNDITVASAITTNNPGGAAGQLTLQAGRSIFVNADITTDDGNLTLIGNDNLASGVIDAQRDAGNAMLTMSSGARINAGSGAVTIELRPGTGRTFTETADITLGEITASSVSVLNHGATTGSDIVFNGTITAANTLHADAINGDVTVAAALTADGTGTSLVLRAGLNRSAGDASGGQFINTAGATALATPNGRWRVYSGDPDLTTEGALTFLKRYNTDATYTTAAAANYIFYRRAPTLTLTADDATRVYGAANPRLTGAIAGFIDGDNAASVGGLTVSTTANAASAVGSHVITSGIGDNSLNYTLRFIDATLTITPATLTYAADTGVSRAYGAANPAFTGTVTGFLNGETLATATTGTLAFTSPATATSNVGHYAINGGGLLATNYVFTQAAGNASALTIAAADLQVLADAQNKISGTADPALTYVASGLVNGDTLTGALARAAGEAAGDYAINRGTLGASPNYALTFTGNTLTIAAVVVPPTPPIAPPATVVPPASVVPSAPVIPPASVTPPAPPPSITPELSPFAPVLNPPPANDLSRRFARPIFAGDEIEDDLVSTLIYLAAIREPARKQVVVVRRDAQPPSSILRQFSGGAVSGLE